MRTILFFLILLFLFNSNCNTEQNANEKADKLIDNTKCEIVFDKNLKEGTVKSSVVRWDGFGGHTYGKLWVEVGGGDSLAFEIIPEQTKNVIEEKLLKGRCVTIEYWVEVFTEEGIEFDRSYTATRLDYP